MAGAGLCRTFASLFKSSALVSKIVTTTRSLHGSQALDGKMKFIKQGIDLTKYTLRPLRLPKSGGRGHDGRIWTHGVGGGHRQNYRMVDFKRVGPEEGDSLVEKVVRVRYDPCRTADIAIVAGGEHKRYILASENMKTGDLIKTSGKLTRIAVRAAEGDAHPVGSLPLGTVVHNVELYPGDGGTLARAAGTSAVLMRKVGDRCILRIPSKREISISQKCMVTVGRVSNVDHNKKHIGKAGRSRWLGIRPQSGLWHRKTGYNGRKIKPAKSIKVYASKPAPRAVRHRFTV